MKNAITVCAFCLVASVAFAALSKEEVKRLNEAATVLNDLRNTPEKGVPEDLWTKTQCVVVIPSMKKAAFIVGGNTGRV